MVLMSPGASGSSTVTFNNAMRNATFNNNQFYKNGYSAKETTTTEQHRIWLDLESPSGTVNRTLVGYVEGATQANDRLYDAFTDYKPTQNFYSLIDSEIVLIQGRSLPFDTNDIVPLGLKAPTNGTYTIAIAAVDGLFSGGNQIVYLEDKLLNIIHNLTASQYQFATNQGIINNRFVLRYTKNTLSNEDVFALENSILVYTNDKLNVKSTLEPIKEVIVYDVLGRMLINSKKINTNHFVATGLNPRQTTLIVKATLENGTVVIKKVLY